MAEKMDDARMVFEKVAGFHESAGPWEGGKIGFAIGTRVFWTDSYTFPGDNTASHAEKVAFAHETVLRLNRGARALAAEADSEQWQNLFESTRASMQQDINRLERELASETERADMAVRQMIKQNDRLAALAQIAAPGAAMEAP